ncbi:hypothetical protein D3C81_2113210 [compost metagenome]
MIPEKKLAQINQALQEDKYDSSATGFGLYSVNHRIRLVFGEAYGLTAISSEDITKMLIRIPLEWEWTKDVEDRNRR